jgi:hypothetical protein
MKLWKFLIRIWFTAASLVSFFVGWAVLAHAPKPNQSTVTNASLSLPKLDPVPSLEQAAIPNQQFGSQPQFSFARPSQQMRVLRSGGS